MGRAVAAAAAAWRMSARGRIFAQTGSSKQASAGTIVSQLRKERLPLRISVPWKRTITPPAACLVMRGPKPNHFLIGGSGYVGDGEAGWKTIARLVAALERNEIKSLERPICWRGSRKKKGGGPLYHF